jgi:lipopolysaccharide transport system permease protein
LPESAAEGRRPAVAFVIRPPGRFLSVDFAELWRFRDLFFVLAWRDIAIRYKQTVLGILWAIIQPVVTMVVFTFIFNRVGRIESGDATPYPIFLYVGLLLWHYYSTTLTNASNSLVSHQSMIQKIYFPRLILPATAATTGLVDLAISSLILAAMMVYYRFTPPVSCLFPSFFSAPSSLPLVLASSSPPSTSDIETCATPYRFSSKS